MNTETPDTPNINLEAESDVDSDGESDDEHDVVGLEVPSTSKSMFVSKISQFEESSPISDDSEINDAERISKSEVSSNAGRL